MKTYQKLLIALLVILIVIQFFHPAKNISAAPVPADISVVYFEPENVHTILSKACNDCHSNNTRYPWYNHIQPVAWWLKNHIKEGKRELNFNKFGTYPVSKQYHKLEGLIDEVKKDEMPLGSYTIIHTDAKLTKDEKLALTGWADSIRAVIKAKYPADSLVRKK